jgi:hypothetical protein
VPSVLAPIRHQQHIFQLTNMKGCGIKLLSIKQQEEHILKKIVNVQRLMYQEKMDKSMHYKLVKRMGNLLE